jgi:hypothetical protein
MVLSVAAAGTRSYLLSHIRQGFDTKKMADSSSFPSQAGMVRRADVALRALYPQLTTRIFEVAPHKYEIVFDRELLDANAINDVFQKSVRPATVWIELSNIAPSSFIHELAPIEDVDISLGFEGCPFSWPDIESILLSRHPDLPRFAEIPNQNNPIKILFSQPLSAEQQEKVRTFMSGCLPDWPIEIGVSKIMDTGHGEPRARPAKIDIEVRSSRLRSRAPSFVRDDEEFWFANVDMLFQGRLASQISAATENAGTACYLDCSSFPQIDLRQAILLYDTIYLTPPITESSASSIPFWEQQALTREDFLHLIEIGRVRLLLTQPEERSDPAFLAAAHERNPSGIIGRLRSAAIMVSDIIATADEYTLAAPQLRPAISELSTRIAKETGDAGDVINRLLLWPLHARRTCLQPLMTRGLMGVAAFSQGTILAGQIRVASGRNFDLEAIVTNNAVHIAHVLNATFIPPSKEMAGWIEPRRIVADRLNFYRSFNTRIAASWAANERRKEEQVPIVPAIPLFDFHPRAPLKDLIAATSFGSVRRKGRAMMTRLSQLPPEDRRLEIDRLCQEMYELGGRRARRSFIVDSLSDGMDIGSTIWSASLPPIRPMWHFLKRTVELARRAPALDRVIDAIEQDLRDQLGRNSDLDFLSKISRVAELRDVKKN